MYCIYVIFSQIPGVGCVHYFTRGPIGVAGIIAPWNLSLYLLIFKVDKDVEEEGRKNSKETMYFARYWGKHCRDCTFLFKELLLANVTLDNSFRRIVDTQKQTQTQHGIVVMSALKQYIESELSFTMFTLSKICYNCHPMTASKTNYTQYPL